jgi:hypothetical protein
MHSKALAISLVTLFFYVPPALAFKLSPRGTVAEKKLSALTATGMDRALQRITQKSVEFSVFAEPVHEEITNRIFGCGTDEICTDPDIGHASQAVLAGVRWNDDPAFMLGKNQARGLGCKLDESIRFTTQPECWFGLFVDAQKRAKRNERLGPENSNLLARSHFGDLQFLHAMASQDGELASETQQRILMWSELMWKIVIGELRLNTNLRDVKITHLDKFFPITSPWTVQELLTLSNKPARNYIKDVALGSLLHMVQDSFASGHTDRAESLRDQMCVSAPTFSAPGVIREFHSYAHQDTGEHAKRDSRDAMIKEIESEETNLIEVGRVIWQLSLENAKWESVKPYFECIFAIQDPNKAASAGAALAND